MIVHCFQNLDFPNNINYVGWTKKDVGWTPIILYLFFLLRNPYMLGKAALDFEGRHYLIADKPYQIKDA